MNFKEKIAEKIKNATKKTAEFLKSQYEKVAEEIKNAKPNKLKSIIESNEKKLTKIEQEITDDSLSLREKELRRDNIENTIKLAKERLETFEK